MGCLDVSTRESFQGVDVRNAFPLEPRVLEDPQNLFPDMRIRKTPYGLPYTGVTDQHGNLAKQVIERAQAASTEESSPSGSEPCVESAKIALTPVRNKSSSSSSFSSDVGHRTERLDTNLPRHSVPRASRT